MDIFREIHSQDLNTAYRIYDLFFIPPSPPKILNRTSKLLLDTQRFWDGILHDAESQNQKKKFGGAFKNFALLKKSISKNKSADYRRNFEKWQISLHHTRHEEK